MQTSIYLPDELADRLKKYLEYSKEKDSKNAVITQALDEYLVKQELNIQWSDRFKQWQGHPQLEIDRKDDMWGEEDVFA